MPPAKEKRKRQCNSYVLSVIIPNVRCHLDLGHEGRHSHKSIRLVGDWRVVINLAWRRI